MNTDKSARTPGNLVCISRERAERFARILESYGCSDDAQYLLSAKESAAPALVEALEEATAWLSAYQHAFPEFNEKGKRIEKMRADLRSAAQGNGAANVATAAIGKARAALSLASGVSRG
jgi:hypothetical protein